MSLNIAVKLLTKLERCTVLVQDAETMGIENMGGGVDAWEGVGTTSLGT